MALSETQICNMALAKIGAQRINNLDTDQTLQAIHCKTHYTQTRDALIRFHWWRFASARVELSESAEAPDFEWSNQFDLPEDFLALRTIFEDNTLHGTTTRRTFAIEGKKLLTDETSMQIRYVKRVVDPNEFDPLFVEVLVLQLASKIVMPLSQDKVLKRELFDELAGVMSRVFMVDRQETNTVGRNEASTWVDSRHSQRIPSHLG